MLQAKKNVELPYQAKDANDFIKNCGLQIYQVAPNFVDNVHPQGMDKISFEQAIQHGVSPEDMKLIESVVIKLAQQKAKRRKNKSNK